MEISEIGSFPSHKRCRHDKRASFNHFFGLFVLWIVHSGSSNHDGTRHESSVRDRATSWNNNKSQIALQIADYSCFLANILLVRFSYFLVGHWGHSYKKTLNWTGNLAAYFIKQNYHKIDWIFRSKVFCHDV